jgi:hypothetical protein
MVSHVKSVQVGSRLFRTDAANLAPGTILTPGNLGQSISKEIVSRVEKITDLDALKRYFEVVWGWIPSSFDITRPRSISMPTIATVGALGEMILEVVRLQEFSHAPSRLHCLFLWETEEQARNYHCRQDLSSTGLYEVEVIECTRVWYADMNIISWSHPEETVLTLMERARRYWRGRDNKSHNASEVLLEGKARIVRSLLES